MITNRSYRELRHLKTFEERFEYLALKGIVGEDTFGFDRIFNQRFYRSVEWKRARDEVIIRDNACDLGIEGYEIHGRLLVHHIVPITMDDIRNQTDRLLDLDNLITVTHATHNAIHYGDPSLLVKPSLVQRTAGDTKLW